MVWFGCYDVFGDLEEKADLPNEVMNGWVMKVFVEQPCYTRSVNNPYKILTIQQHQKYLPRLTPLLNKFQSSISITYDPVRPFQLL